MKSKNTNKKRGISLIVLVITILVMIVLAVTVIITLSNSGIISKAIYGKNAFNIKSAEEQLSTAIEALKLDKIGDIKLIDLNEFNDDSSKNYQKNIDVIPEVEEDDIVAIAVINNEFIFEIDEKFGITYKDITGIEETEEVVKLNVTFDAQGGSINKNKIKVTKYSTFGSLPIPTKKGYIFVGWSRSNQSRKLVKENSIITESNDFTLYAIWNTDINISLSSVVKNGTYGFEYNNGILSSTNTYLANTSSVSYIPIDLTSYSSSEKFFISIAARTSSEGCDGFNAAVSESTSDIYSNIFLTLSGESNYEIGIKEVSGGKVYYLHLTYGKDGSIDVGEDKAYVYGISVEKKDANKYLTYSCGEYGFKQTVNDSLSSTNTGKNSTTCHSFKVVDLRNYQSAGTYEMTIDAEISSEIGKDIAYVFVTNSPVISNLNDESNRKLCISGTDKQQVKLTLDGGNIYYIHMLYVKDADGASGNDMVKFSGFEAESTAVCLSGYKFEYNGTYVFKNNGSVLESKNNGIAGSMSWAYTEIDLSDKPTNETYVVTVLARISSEGCDYGYAAISETKDATTNNYFIAIAGEVPVNEYTKEIQGGKKYYLHIAYGKDYSCDSGEDRFVIEGISVEKKGNISTYQVGDYGFVNYTNNSIISTNKGKKNTTCKTVRIIDLRNYVNTSSYDLDLEVNVSGSGYAYIGVNNSININVSDELTRKLYITGNKTEKVHVTLEGGKIYYLHMAYIKDDSDSTGTDKVIISNYSVTQNPTKVSGYNFIYNSSYSFKNNGNAIESKNNGIAGSTAWAYTEIDLSDKPTNETYVVTVLARISSEGCDYGYAAISETKDATTNNYFIAIAGEVPVNEYTKEIQGGKKYYLHIAYGKDYSCDSGEDRFVIEGISVDKKTAEKISLYQNGNYGLKKVANDSYASTNKGIANSVSEGVRIIDLRNYSDALTYDFDVEVKVSGSGYAYLGINNSININMSDESIRKVYITGNKTEKIHLSLKCGTIYYVHMAYIKNSASSSGEDTAKFNNYLVKQTPIKLSGYDVIYNSTYVFKNSGDCIISTNHGDATGSWSYIEIDLSDKSSSDTYVVTTEASINSEGCDHGRMAISETKEATMNNCFVDIAGYYDKTTYTTEIIGGKKYYLHISYCKDYSMSSGDDTFKVYSLSINKK